MSGTTAYPICRSASKFKKQVQKKLAGVPAEVIDKVRQTQPFVTGPNQPDLTALWQLHHLAGRDRHRLVRPVLAALNASKDLNASSSPGGHIEVHLNPQRGEPLFTLAPPVPSLEPPRVTINVAYEISVELDDLRIPNTVPMGEFFQHHLDRNRHQLGVEIGQFTASLQQEVVGIVRRFTDLG